MTSRIGKGAREPWLEGGEERDRGAGVGRGADVGLVGGGRMAGAGG